MDDSVKEFVRFQVNRKIIDLYKNFLVILEDLNDKQYNIPDKLHQNMRKKVLDYGNDTIRELNTYIDKVNIEIK
jgi:hypothetical protein